MSCSHPNLDPNTGLPEFRLAEAAIYSDVPEINRRLFDSLPPLHSAGYTFTDASPIAYGTKISLRTHDKTITVSLYFSAKKGFSVVIPPNVPNPHAERIRTILLASTENVSDIAREEETRYQSWIGADEAGKGDYMGPLVTAAFLITSDMVQFVRGLGVRDSKQIKNEECRKIARKLFTSFQSRISLTALLPETYNRLYADFSAEGKSLNGLLTWAHAKSIGNLLPLNPDAVIIDRFASEFVIRRQIRTTVPLIARPRAEDNVAVAAASILARAHYLHHLEQLSKSVGVDLVSGSGTTADDAARAIVRKHGRDALNRTVKLHFKNTQRAFAI